MHWPAVLHHAYRLCVHAGQVHDEDGKPFELEISWICDESGRTHQRVPEPLLSEAIAAAKAALADSDMCVIPCARCSALSLALSLYIFMCQSQYHVHANASGFKRPLSGRDADA